MTESMLHQGRCVHEVSLVQKPWCLRNGAKHTDLTLLMLNKSRPVLANSVDPDQLASEEAN